MAAQFVAEKADQSGAERRRSHRFGRIEAGQKAAHGVERIAGIVPGVGADHGIGIDGDVGPAAGAAARRRAVQQHGMGPVRQRSEGGEWIDEGDGLNGKHFPADGGPPGYQAPAAAFRC
jgi:hypothetical protein